MVPNPNFNPHFDASSLRDSHPQLSQSNELDLLNTQIAKAAVLVWLIRHKAGSSSQSDFNLPINLCFKTPAEDILTEDELKGIAIEQMETAEVSGQYY